MKLPFLVLMFSLCVCCSSQEQGAGKDKYFRQVGDIPFDAGLDDPKFEICDETRALQYYVKGNSLNYNGEKIALVEKVMSLYDPSGVSKESGYVTIRFIVNCQGQPGRFRVSSMDLEYTETVIDKKITMQLLAITEGLNGWKTLTGGGNSYDYYQYLTFKIESGDLIEIMP